MKYFAYCRRSSDAEDRQVMSIESQMGELRRLFGALPGVEIVEWHTESKSAKSPGRPIFDGLISRIERGDASGIVAWAPDRLARNSIDGGRLIYLLDMGKLIDLKFATYTFENNSQGKFMLQIMFGQSKYYSDALSENVKRGNRTKIENGWRPNMAPLGYLNDSATKTIVNDPVHFPLIRKMFEIMLTGNYSTRQIARIAREDWGFRPSIGNWTLKCRSHYVINCGKVIEAGPWSDEQVEAERRRDHASKARFYGHSPKVESGVQPTLPEVTTTILHRIWDWVSGR